MSSIKLHDTDYVLWDKANDKLVRWESNDDIVIYGDIENAKEDCYGNVLVTRCTDLPEHHQQELVDQIKRYYEE